MTGLSTEQRQRLAERHLLNLAYRLLVGVIGTLVVIVGLIAVPLPGPGWATVILGLIVLATEFQWAERQLGFTRRQIGRWSCWARRQPRWSRLLLAAGTASLTYLILVITLRVIGIPEWVPGWVPLWR
jgi:uncharacterized protein (TIGR02611 family)